MKTHAGITNSHKSVSEFPFSLCILWWWMTQRQHHCQLYTSWCSLLHFVIPVMSRLLSRSFLCWNVRCGVSNSLLSLDQRWQKQEVMVTKVFWYHKWHNVTIVTVTPFVWITKLMICIRWYNDSCNLSLSVTLAKKSVYADSTKMNIGIGCVFTRHVFKKESTVEPFITALFDAHFPFVLSPAPCQLQHS
jgi:hypothetical protein